MNIEELRREDSILEDNPQASGRIGTAAKPKKDSQLGIHNLDARELDAILAANTVDVTITSPPYFDLKNYGHENQIGYGQKYPEYLADLKSVFQKVHAVTKDTGSLWVIIDMFKKDGQVIPLPFDFVAELKTIGWLLQEVIIWGKDRTVPWAKEGQMRNSFEYILVFTKTDRYKFHIERVKSVDTLKKWWIRYPERYHPKGKSPDGIWNFPIPTQGSWGKGYIRHFCPLPEGLISQILTIATDENDVVLDPFAGTGSVLSRAANMSRRFVGFELNPDYISMFKKYVEETGHVKKAAYENSKTCDLNQKNFERLILQLRQLKYSRMLFQVLRKDYASLAVQRMLVLPTKEKSSEKHKILKCEYHLLAGTEVQDELSLAINKSSTAPPLSKFGVEPVFVIHANLNSFIRAIARKSLWVYTLRNTHSMKRKFNLSDLSKGGSDEVIYSTIKVAVDENLYE